MVNFLLLIPWIFFWQGYMYHWSAFVFYHCTFSSTSCDSTHVHCVVERVPPGCWGPAYPSLPNPLLPTPRGTTKDTTHQYSSTAGKRSVIVQYARTSNGQWTGQCAVWSHFSNKPCWVPALWIQLTIWLPLFYTSCSRVDQPISAFHAFRDVSRLHIYMDQPIRNKWSKLLFFLHHRSNQTQNVHTD